MKKVLEEQESVSAASDPRSSRRSRAGRSSPCTARRTPRGRTTPATSATPGSTPTREASTRRCTGAGCGPCGSSRATAAPPRRTPGSSAALDHGGEGLSVAFNLPTLMGHDPDHPLSPGRGGRVRCRRSPCRDMGIALQRHPPSTGHDLDDHQRARGHAPRVLRPASPSSRASGRAQARRHPPGGHPQGVHRPEGVHLPAPAQSMRTAPDMVALLRGASCRRWHSISISGYHVREAGANGGAGARLHAAPAGSRTSHAACRRAGSTWTSSRPRLSLLL